MRFFSQRHDQITEAHLLLRIFKVTWFSQTMNLTIKDDKTAPMVSASNIRKIHLCVFPSIQYQFCSNLLQFEHWKGKQQRDRSEFILFRGWHFLIGYKCFLTYWCCLSWLLFFPWEFLGNNLINKMEKGDRSLGSLIHSKI